MTPERWRRVLRIFEAVADAPNEQRAALLDENCGDDSELRLAVQGLLEADATDRRDDDTSSEIRRVSAAGGRVEIEGYMILGQIGWGGMSSVFLGQREGHDDDREVAIKVLRQDIPEAEARIAREAGLLESLEHPYVARFFDAGTTHDHRPFVVMEFIDGTSITRFCSRRGLEIEDRIELFRKVCDAVSAAHRRLIVHRDIKPSNVLVTEGGTPKLLDFGIGKLLGSSGRLAETTASTRFLTRSYAAPELFTGEEMTTAVDVYSLGVVLYELLAGCLPRQVSGENPAEVVERWRRLEPTPPSARVFDVDDEITDPDQRARRRGLASAASLAARLKGDLDNIVLKAISFEPDRRYRSAQELADDLGRHLDGLPVLAGPPDPWYRLGKALRRHARTIATASVVIGTILVFSIVTTIQAGQLAAERDEARRQAARAEAVTEFLVDALKLAGPTNGGGQLSAEELIDLAGQDLDESLEEHPEVKARLHGVVAGIELNLASYADARRHVEKALELLRRQPGHDFPREARLRVLQARIAIGEGELETAAEILDELDGRNGELEDLDLGSVHRTRAELLAIRGRLDEAREQAQAAIANHRGAAEEQVKALVADYSILVQIEYLQGDFEAAEDTALRALASSRKAYPASGPQVAEALGNLGAVLSAKERLDEAEDLYVECLALLEKRLGPTHPTLAVALQNLGNVRSRLGDHESAENLLRRSLEIQSAHFDDDHLALAQARHNYAVELVELGRLPEAVEYLRAALRTFEARMELTQPWVGHTLHRLGATLYLQGRYAEAAEVLARALEARSVATGPDSIATNATRLVSGRALLELGRVAEARERFRDAKRSLTEARGEKDWLVATAVMRLSEAELASGHVAAAKAEIDAATEALEGSDHESAELRLAEARGIGGAVLAAIGDPEEARIELETSYRLLLNLTDSGSEQVRGALRRLVDFFERIGDAEASRRYRVLLEESRGRQDAAPSVNK